MRFMGTNSFIGVKRALLERVRELRVGQRFEKREKLGLLFGSVLQFLDTRVEVGMSLDTIAVVVNHLLERVKPAIVHIRRGDLDISQGRRLELAELPWVEGDFTHPAVTELVVHIESGIRWRHHREVS